ncbi:MAG: aspartate kinase [Myxococcota bacterium]|nr:aspartate kinase [Myxococcota bacterium]
MGIIVQKYGGSSVATPDKLKAVARRVVETCDEGHRVVVVVSAMGNTTNELLALAQSVSPNPQRRELDMLVTVGERISMALLSMAIHDLGRPAVSFTGSQSGIITTDNHANARIIRVTPTRIRDALHVGKIVIVAGFQGVSERREITSLGRGGSDTTAVALAAALNAEYAEICSDVDGVYSADPRTVANATRIDQMSYEEMQSLADGGAKVVHAEAVEWARRNRIDLRCTATAGARARGTHIHGDEGALNHPRVVGVTRFQRLFVIEPAVSGQPPPEALSETLVAHGALSSAFWRMPQGWLCYVPTDNVHGTDAFRAAIEALPGVQIREDHTAVSIVGRALSAPPGLAAQASRILSKNGIDAYAQWLGPSRLTFLVLERNADRAVAVFHKAFIDENEGTSSD